MVRNRIAALAFTAATLAVVVSVPAFAQTTSGADPAMRETDRTGTGIARVLYTGAAESSSRTIPQNLIVAPVFRRAVDAMLQRSPTFRRQCTRIANAPQTTVVIEWFRPQSADRSRARTVISSRHDGQRHAAVLIRTADDPVELIAHELEHVLEQLDEIDLRTLAAVPASRVHGSGEDTFETIRAIRAGQAATAEMRRHGT